MCAEHAWRCVSLTFLFRARSPLPRWSWTAAVRGRMRDVAYVALGSNIGDRHAYLALGRDGLAALPRSRLRAVSTIEETEPLGPIVQGPYLNQMAAVETDLTPDEL